MYLKLPMLMKSSACFLLVKLKSRFAIKLQSWSEFTLAATKIIGYRLELNEVKVRWEETKMRQVLIYPGEDNYWVAECPSLPGCISQGTGKEEAVENIKEAIDGYVAALMADGLPVPPDNFEALLLAV